MGQHWGDIFIYVNKSFKTHHLVSNKGVGNEYKDVSSNGVFKLSKGDTVYIYMRGFFYKANSDCLRTYFQGHLIDLL